MAVAALLAACGGGEESSSRVSEPAGTYDVRVTEASFPREQNLGETSLLRLGFRNTGEKAVPVLTVTISVAGKQGETSSLPFAVQDPTPGLAQPDRPVWVLAATYPRLFGSPDPGGASTANNKTFAFGKVKPGQTIEAVWKLSAVREGRYALRYSVAAGVTGEAKAQTAGGRQPGGTLRAEITSELPETEVTDGGAVVEKKSVDRQRSGDQQKPGER